MLARMIKARMAPAAAGMAAAATRGPATPADAWHGPLARRLGRRLVRGGRLEGRRGRYLLTALLGMGVIWGAAIAYLKLAPKGYSSGFTLVLPGSGAGASINLESLGQATTTSSSAFSTPEQSPTENYRRMLISSRVIAAAAALSHDPYDKFPLPKIELVDMTKLIMVTLTGPTAEQAEKRAAGLRTAFLTTLDELRQDEIQGREASYKDMLAAYKQSLDRARQRLIEQEATSGLVSLDQYNAMVTALEGLRQQLRQEEAKEAETRGVISALTKALGADAETASAAMVLRADPLFQALIDQLAKQDAELAQLDATLGANNPKLAELQAQRKTTAARLAERGAQLTGRARDAFAKARDLSTKDERARLFERLVSASADEQGLLSSILNLCDQIATQQERVVALAKDASHLDDLKRDVQVAEAVFSSALARIGTTKSDIFASYPMVQTLEAPQVPERPSSPSPLLAIGGGLMASLALTFSLVLVWLRTALLRRLLKSA
jgi:uncharacterized protein involved in exopolysaccharide biosynthesis